MKINSVLGVTH